MNKLMKKKKKGFTLIELIAVIAILAVLAVIAVPRVISYVEKSKKVAIQTEAATIYNAAEAAYNDGKLKIKDGNPLVGETGAKSFDEVTVSNAVTALKSQDLLSNVNTNKFKNIENIKLKDLKTIMNANLDDIKLNGDNLAELPKSSNEVDSSSVTQGQGHK